MNSALPGGLNTLVVDTSPDAMAAENLPILGRRPGNNPNRMSGGAPGMGIQSRTLRMGGGGGYPQQQQPQQAPHPMANTIVTVRKLE